MKIRVALPSTGIEEYRALKKIIYSGKFVSGKNVSKFEEKFAKHNNVKYACAVNSATSAIFLIMKEKRTYVREPVTINIPSMIPPVVTSATV